jgi:UrcA family protein
MIIKTCVADRIFDRKALLPAVALATLLFGVPGSALADGSRPSATAESVTAKVSLADLDVSTPEGARAASARLAKMAQRLCRKLGDTRRASDSATYADCYRETLANALRQVNVPVVAGLPAPNPPRH